jgi:hypothetical protein
MQEATARARIADVEEPIDYTPENEYQPTPDDIRARAYEIYLSRGPEEGSEIEDWLQAERELSQGRGGISEIES